MKKVFQLFIFSLIGIHAGAQSREKPVAAATQQTGSKTEQQLENLTENSADDETEDDSYLLELDQYLKDPVNINSDDESVFKSFHVSPIQIKNLILYRQLLGDLVNIYELQAVPGWDLATIERIRPYITVSKEANVFHSFFERLHDGDHSVMVRVSQVLERSAGYLNDPASGKNYYTGSPQKLFLRYRYNYRNLLQYGVVAEKDAGEEFFQGSQKHGFDFYSAHVFLRRSGIIRSLALGDYTVNLGQGLTQWMSLAFKKGPDVIAAKREADVLKPYSSAGEINFHRGAGITLAKNNWEATVFASLRKVDANFISVDSSQTNDDYVSSLQTSGLHRTKSEIADKGIQRQLAFGGNLSYRLNALHVGLNGIQYQLKYPLQKSAEPYNLYALSGKSFGNYSTDYSYTYQNLHFYGEAAMSNKKYTAFVNGLLISTAANVDMSFIYRNISKGYQSLYTNAFTENTYPTNEKGFFSGISVRPVTAWRIDAYADWFTFPWLKFRVDAPTAGSDYLLHTTYTPGKNFEIYFRYKSESKSINYNHKDSVLNPVIPQTKQDFRTQFSYKLNKAYTFRGRAEMLWYDKRRDDTEKGFLIHVDVLYSALMKPYGGNIRLQYFETDGYNSRIYAYENDVLYSFSIPVFYGKGYRYYINMNYNFNKNITIWAKIAQYVYPNVKSIGSSLDIIHGNHKFEAKLQLLYKF